MKKNLLISAFIFLLLFVGLETSFLYWFPRLMPANFVQMVVDEGLNAAMQSSKQSVIPDKYVALLGDSYAQGMGDWATNEMSKPMARYGVAHLLQDATGKDVVSFGSAGAGSVRALVTEPVTQLAYLRQYIDKDFPDPALALVFFYEGNDLYDNAAYFKYSFPRLFDRNQQFDAATYQKYLQQFAIERDETWQIAQSGDWLRYLPFTAILDKLGRSLSGIPPRAGPATKPVDNSLDPPWIFGGATYRQPGEINQALIRNARQQLPDLIQGPAMNLNEEEWQQAWFSFEQALQFSRKKFPDTKFVLVYVPSVITTYTIASDNLSLQSYERRENNFSNQQVSAVSLKMREQFAAIARKQNLPMIDTTDTLRAAALQEFLHGPADWNHLNRRGYEVLAAAITNQWGK
jgi:hypothetical protein